MSTANTALFTLAATFTPNFCRGDKQVGFAHRLAEAANAVEVGSHGNTLKFDAGLGCNVCCNAGIGIAFIPGRNRKYWPPALMAARAYLPVRRIYACTGICAIASHFLKLETSARLIKADYFNRIGSGLITHIKTISERLFISPIANHPQYNTRRCKIIGRCCMPVQRPAEWI
ncbi:MAG: hypothetical protein Q7T25_10970 [Sideroxyarcus sp.]|nr:hypothetical protein [Sideroxyarcus sp.]